VNTVHGLPFFVLLSQQSFAQAPTEMLLPWVRHIFISPPSSHCFLAASLKQCFGLHVPWFLLVQSVSFVHGVPSLHILLPKSASGLLKGTPPGGMQLNVNMRN
jgi:hypothetical protein